MIDAGVVSRLVYVLYHYSCLCYVIICACVTSFIILPHVILHFSVMTSLVCFAITHVTLCHSFCLCCRSWCQCCVMTRIIAMSLAVLEQRYVKSKNKIQKLTRTPRRPPPPRWRPVVAAAGGACPASPAPGSWPRATPGRTSLGRWPPGCWTRGRTGPWGCAACPSACACLGLTITWYPSCISGGTYPRMNRKMNE